MATFVDLMFIARYGAFKERVLYAVEKAANDVMNESAGTTDHAGRVTYAKKVLSGQADTDDYSIGVVTNATIAAEADVSKANTDFGIPDGDIQFTVNSLFNDYAGIST